VKYGFLFLRHPDIGETESTRYESAKRFARLLFVYEAESEETVREPIKKVFLKVYKEKSLL
jgi:hypothetical protein